MQTQSVEGREGKGDSPQSPSPQSTMTPAPPTGELNKSEIPVCQGFFKSEGIWPSWCRKTSTAVGPANVSPELPGCRLPQLCSHQSPPDALARTSSLQTSLWFWLYLSQGSQSPHLLLPSLISGPKSHLCPQGLPGLRNYYLSNSEMASRPPFSYKAMSKRKRRLYMLVERVGFKSPKISHRHHL